MHPHQFLGAIGIGAISLVGSACSTEGISPESPEPPETPYVAGVILVGNNQQALVGQALAGQVGVRVVDQFDTPMPGLLVGFVVSAGDGSLGAAQVTTDDRGEAATSWTLGVVSTAQQRVSPTVAGYTKSIGDLVATARPGPAAKLAVLSGGGQSAMIGTELPAPLVVQVADAYDNPVSSGVVVRWEALTGGGWTSADSSVTESTGNSSIIRTLGPDLGEASTVARLADSTIPSVSFAATAVPLVSQYTIELSFSSTMTPAQTAAITAAAARWSSIIIGDLPSAAPGALSNDCGVWWTDSLPGTVDDLLIFVHVDSIDGPGGSFGAGYPCIRREGKALVGIVRFDAADLATLEAGNLLEAAALSEIAHAMGFGNLWAYQTPALAVFSGLEPLYVGPRAVRQFQLNGGVNVGFQSVPIEYDTGGGDPGWASPGDYSYWRESVMGAEVMTPILNPGANPLSTITIATFADMGYTVSYADADPYNVELSASPATAASRTSATSSRTRPNPFDQALTAHRGRSTSR